jgi:hypothetical protein
LGATCQIFVLVRCLKWNTVATVAVIDEVKIPAVDSRCYELKA